MFNVTIIHSPHEYMSRRSERLYYVNISCLLLIAMLRMSAHILIRPSSIESRGIQSEPDFYSFDLNEY